MTLLLEHGSVRDYHFRRNESGECCWRLPDTGGNARFVINRDFNKMYFASRPHRNYIYRFTRFSIERETLLYFLALFRKLGLIIARFNANIR